MNMIEWEGKKFAYFCNKECEYFPCHPIEEQEEFNCLFCYCPLYGRSDCGGVYTFLENGLKDCSSCVIPHRKENYGVIVKHFMESTGKDLDKE